ncbi:hypothetical protein EIP91_010383 [Steccherinum ochraceum]|uniref:Xylosidase/arabinosidase n=1 Tax=Steccherinum ochraceum TaxID=92696 RepID=A0A4R0RZD1_9APHY|nr:hypothetical protein EIP91_010383 [Steccherinum ochraceum]
MALNGDGKVLRRADPSTIQDKFMVGYQGWFTCPGDGKPLDPHHHGWLHWFNYPIPDGGRPNTDLWPDVSEYSPSELFPAPGLKLATGEQTYLFSSRNAKSVQRHFHWMALHGVDGAFLQRFAGQCDLEAGNQAIRDQRDEVGDRVREAAEKEGRVFAIMYDVSGVPPDRIQRVLEQDWRHLIHDKGVLDSPNYLREKGKAVVTLWGFGFADSKHDPATVRAITAFFRNNTPGGAYIMAGTPAHWRTSVSDADPNPDFVNVWLEDFDAISPWTIGRYSSPEEADRFAEEKIKGDVELIRSRNERFEMGQGGKRKVDYIPVIFPGGSGFNLSEGKWGFNDIKRRGGNFLWRELFNVRRLNVRTIYGAMWDEYDEGTAFMPVVQNKRQLPVHEKYNFMALDEDGFDLPSDWYMRICGFAAEGLRGERMIHETFPSKELQDYWSTRPRYEDTAGPSSSGLGSGKKDKEGESWEEWDAKGKSKDVSNEPPPPPYTLEDDVPLQNQPVTQTTPAQTYPPTALGSSSSPMTPAGFSSASPAPRQQSPAPPLATRPHIAPTSGIPASATPPPLKRSSRPASVASSASSAVSYANEHASGQPFSGSVLEVSGLADQLARQSLSPQAQQAQPSVTHATRPTSPLANQATKPHIGPSPNTSSQQAQANTPTDAQVGSNPASAPSTNEWSKPSWPGQQAPLGSAYTQSPSSPPQLAGSYANAYQPSYAPVYGPQSSQSGQPNTGPQFVPQHSQTAPPFPGGSTFSPPPGPPPPQSQSPYLNQSPNPSYPAGAPPLQHSSSLSGHSSGHQHTTSQSSYPGQQAHAPTSPYPPPNPLQHAASYPGAAAEPGIGGFSFPPAPAQQDYYGAPQGQYPQQQPYQQPGQYNQYGQPQYPPQPGAPGGYPYQGAGPYGTYPSYPSYY